jgi:5'(3')-deoxyribonucleotidase
MEIKGYDLSPIGDNLTWEEKEAVLLEPGLFRSLEVIPEAKLGVYRLLESCEVIIATALPKGGAITAAYDKTKWVEENFPAVSWEERIIFTHRKELIRPSDNKRMTVIIDDNPEILRRVSPNTYQIVYSQPWNKKYIPSLPPARRDKVWRSGDWSKIPDYIRSLARRS